MTTAAFIGTFDPFHGGHIGQLLRAHHYVPLTKIYILVNKHPSHKPGASSWQHRIAMAELTLESFKPPFEHAILPIENSFANDLTESIDYKIIGIDSLVEDLGEQVRWPLAQKWPMLVLSIPGIDASSLTNAVAALPQDIQSTISVYQRNRRSNDEL